MRQQSHNSRIFDESKRRRVAALQKNGAWVCLRTQREGPALISLQCRQPARRLIATSPEVAKR